MTCLPPAAVPAWEAYCAMIVSKQRHFDFLRFLENEYERYGAPNADERAELAERLNQHDKNVSEFKAAVAVLKVRDAAAYAELIARLSQLANDSDD